MLEAEPEAHMSRKDMFKDNNRKVRSLIDRDEEGLTCA